MEPIKCLIRCYFSCSNAFAFIEDLGNQTKSVVFNHNCYGHFALLVVCLKVFMGQRSILKRNTVGMGFPGNFDRLTRNWSLMRVSVDSTFPF